MKTADQGGAEGHPFDTHALYNDQTDAHHHGSNMTGARAARPTISCAHTRSDGKRPLHAGALIAQAHSSGAHLPNDGQPYPHDYAMGAQMDANGAQVRNDHQVHPQQGAPRERPPMGGADANIGDQGRARPQELCPYYSNVIYRCFNQTLMARDMLSRANGGLTQPIYEGATAEIRQTQPYAFPQYPMQDASASGVSPQQDEDLIYTDPYAGPSTYNVGHMWPQQVMGTEPPQPSVFYGYSPNVTIQGPAVGGSYSAPSVNSMMTSTGPIPTLWPQYGNPVQLLFGKESETARNIPMKVSFTASVPKNGEESSLTSSGEKY